MKIFRFRSIIIFIISFLIIYSAYWIFLSIQVRSKINNIVEETKIISFDSISIIGFPYRIEAQIKNLFINNDAEEIIFSSSSPLIKIDMNPMSLNKFLIRAENINSHINIKDLLIDISMNGVRSAITNTGGSLSEIIVAINEADIKFNNMLLDEVSKIYFKHENTENFKRNINLSAEGSNLIPTGDGNMKLELNGTYEIDKNKINGDLLLEIIDISNNQKLFSAPLKIQDNIASFLFIPLIDLNELFYSF